MLLPPLAARRRARGTSSAMDEARKGGILLEDGQYLIHISNERGAATKLGAWAGAGRRHGAAT